MINLKIFTEDEKAILRSLPNKYKWIARDYRNLYIFTEKPKYNEDCGLWDLWLAENGLAVDGVIVDLFDHIFKRVTVENSPILFREPVEPVLDKIERAYLKAALRPFKERIAYVKKLNKEYEELQYIRVMLKNSDWMSFPPFEAETMYKGMTVGREYSLAELGIKYD